MVAGSGYDLLLSDDSGIYGYNFDAEENMVHMIMDDANSDVEFSRLVDLMAVGEENFIARYGEEPTDISDAGEKLIKLVNITLE